VRFLVRAAFFAAALRALRGRRRAADFACRDSAFRDAVLRGSRLSLRIEARARFAAGRRPDFARRLADRALRFVDSVALGGGEGRSTPARRAFDSPMAIACLADRAPCFPSRT